MKKVISLIAALALCCACAGCAASKKEAQTPETTVAETAATTQPQETVAATETVPVAEEPVNAYFKNPNFNFGYQDEEVVLEVYDCRMYPSETGITRFEVDYKTVAGLQPVVYAFADDGDDEPNYWNVVENLTTGEESTLVFEMEEELLDMIYQPGILFRNQYGFDVSGIEIFHREIRFVVTEGNPVGEAKELQVSKNGNVTVSGAHMQALDNGYIRFTVECKPQKDRYISFYNPPEGDRFMLLNFEPTSGEPQTIVADLREEDVKGLHDFNLNFFNGDASVGHIYLHAPITEFEELDASQFAGFIGGGQFMLLYYGVIDEAVLGATITAEDGTSVQITEDILDKNGDGNSLLIFKECKVKKGDTVTVTLSKEGCEDISFSVFVH